MTPRGLTFTAPLWPDVEREARVAYEALGLLAAVRVFLCNLPADGATLVLLDRYEVLLSPLVPLALLPSIAVHELRHVWQVETGRFHVFDPSLDPVLARLAGDEMRLRWHGQPWQRPDEQAPYPARPWEEDAFDFERRWARSRGLPASRAARKHAAWLAAGRPASYWESVPAPA